MGIKLNLKSGQKVRVTLEGRTVEAWVTVASGNGVSLVLVFDAMLGGYAGMMPLLWTDEDSEYHEIIMNRIVQVEEDENPSANEL